MAWMAADGDELVVRLTWRERLAARRGEVRVPLAAVCRVTVEPDWWRALRGDPVRGLWIPGVRCIGTRCHLGGADFVVLRPGRPAVCAELWPSAPFRLLAVCVPTRAEAEATARSLAGAAPHLDTSTPCRQPLPVPGEDTRRPALRGCRSRPGRHRRA
ncbi:hypothetical protein [Streptomyces sp. NPDC002671]